jgi:hypothetical protein
LSSLAKKKNTIENPTTISKKTKTITVSSHDDTQSSTPTKRKKSTIPATPHPKKGNTPKKTKTPPSVASTNTTRSTSTIGSLVSTAKRGLSMNEGNESKRKIDKVPYDNQHLLAEYLSSVYPKKLTDIQTSSLTQLQEFALEGYPIGDIKRLFYLLAGKYGGMISEVTEWLENTPRTTKQMIKVMVKFFNRIKVLEQQLA